ncbi:MAG: leucine-rich repeat protein [Atopobiaceae bacterium]|nr:leucine-rich repeat protein [Atopobiaceae bacterium]
MTMLISAFALLVLAIGLLSPQRALAAELEQTQDLATGMSAPLESANTLTTSAQATPELEALLEAQVALSPEAVTTGTCGANLVWSITSDGVLVVSGSGAMTSAPWLQTGIDIRAVALPTELTAICDGAFAGCASLPSIDLPANLTTIGREAFSGCNSLTSLTLPSKLTTIKPMAFKDCVGLTELTLPNTVTSLGYSFIEGTSITSITIPASLKSASYVRTDGVVTKGILTGADQLQSVTFADGLSLVPIGSCKGLANLKSVSIPGSATKISEYAFDGCKGLETLSYGSADKIPAELTIEHHNVDLAPFVEVIVIPMHRLYNPNSGEHFYTGSTAEKNNVVAAGWRYEGIGWYAPSWSRTPVYRLYNPNAGDHHYTTNEGEKNYLVKVGWRDEGIGWYSDDAKSVPLYRQYNPNAKAGSHNFTTSLGENNMLVSVGWRAEGIGWYGVKA